MKLDLPSHAFSMKPLYWTAEKCKSSYRFCAIIPTHPKIPHTTHATSFTAWSQSRRKAMTWLHWTCMSFRGFQIQRNLAVRQALLGYIGIYFRDWVRLNTVGPFHHHSFSNGSSVMWPKFNTRTYLPPKYNCHNTNCHKTQTWVFMRSKVSNSRLPRNQSFFLKLKNSH